MPSACSRHPTPVHSRRPGAMAACSPTPTAGESGTIMLRIRLVAGHCRRGAGSCALQGPRPDHEHAGCDPIQHEPGAHRWGGPVTAEQGIGIGATLVTSGGAASQAAALSRDG